MARGEGSDEDVGGLPPRRIVDEFVVGDFQTIVVEDAEIVDGDGLVFHEVVQGSGGGDLLGLAFVLLFPEFAPEGIEGEFAGGLFALVGNHVVGIELNAFAQGILGEKVRLLLGRLETAVGVGGPPGGFRLAFDPHVDIIFEQPLATLSGGKVVHFVNAEYLVAFFNRLAKFGGAPRSSNAAFSGAVLAQPGAVHEPFGQFNFHARSAERKRDFAFATVRQHWMKQSFGR